MDSFLLPVVPVPAFPRNHSEQTRHRLLTPEGPLPCVQGLLSHLSMANLTDCPATVAPAGKTANGPPVEIQILGPCLDDATPIWLASRLATENGGAKPPMGY